MVLPGLTLLHFRSFFVFFVFFVLIYRPSRSPFRAFASIP
jgi:hypothetical protein